MHNKRVSRFSVENFQSRSAEKLHGRTLLFFRKFLVWKKIMDKRGEGGRGVLRFSVENFLSHRTEKFRRGTLLCSRKFLISKNFMMEGGESRFETVKIFGTIGTRIRYLPLQNPAILLPLLSFIFE